MNKKIITVLGIVVILCGTISGIYYEATHGGLLLASASGSCSSQNGVNLTADEAKQASIDGRIGITFTNNGSTITSTIVNHTGCDIPLSQITYRMYDQKLSTQEFNDGTLTTTLHNNEQTTLTTSLPSCMAQTDVYYGTGPHQLYDDNRAGDITLGWKYTQNNGQGWTDASGNFCKHLTTIPAPTVNAACASHDSSGDKTPGVTISWNDAGRGSQGYYVDITDQNDFSNGGWSEQITSPNQTSLAFTDFSSFSPFNNATGQLHFTPGQTYHARIYYSATQEHSLIITFTIPQCETQPQTGCIAIHKETFDPSGNVVNPVAQFTFKLDNNQTTQNDAQGNAQFNNVSVGDHTVSELSQSGWTNILVTPSNGVVHVTAGSQCVGVVFKNQQNSIQHSNLDGYCTVSPNNTYIGNNVTWTAYPLNGNSNNYTYSWSGTDGLSGSSNTVSRTYNYSGTKSGTVTISDGVNTITRSCSMYVYPDNNNNNLNVSCSASSQNTQVGSTVTYYANASGGNGGYSYSWVGTDGLGGNNQSVSRTYYNPGSKYATVTVYSNGQQASATCNTYINQNNYNNNLDGSCYASVQNNGTQVMWYATASGGNNYYNNYNNNNNYSYSWNGTDGLYGNGSSVYKQYSYPGQKNATVAISDGTQTIYRTCTISVNPPYIPPPVYIPPQQPGGVYLSQVPYTGSTGSNVTLFILGLMVWSAGVSYFLIRRKAKRDGLTMGQVISNLNPMPKLVPAFASVPTTFLGETATEDTSTMTALENHARLLHTVVSADGLKVIAEQAGYDTNAALATLEQLVAAQEATKKHAEDWTVLTTEKIESALF